MDEAVPQFLEQARIFAIIPEYDRVFTDGKRDIFKNMIPPGCRILKSLKKNKASGVFSKSPRRRKTYAD
jgi:hypothetical protein